MPTLMPVTKFIIGTVPYSTGYKADRRDHAGQFLSCNQTPKYMYSYVATVMTSAVNHASM